MKTIILTFILFSTLININTMGQVYDDIYFVGYKDKLPIFYNAEINSSFALCNDNDQKILKKYPQRTFLQSIIDSTEIIYDQNNMKYIIIIAKDTFIYGSNFIHLAINEENKTIFATLPKEHDEHPLEIIKINLQNDSIEFTGLKGYVDRIVNDYLYFYIETNPKVADSTYDIYIVNKNTLMGQRKIFERQSLNLDFEISADGNMIFGRNSKKRAIINIHTNEEQIINYVPIYNYNELPPIFSYDRKHLIFYQSKPFEVEKIKIEIN